MKFDDVLMRAVVYVRSRVREEIRTGVILGSGLGEAAGMVEVDHSFEYRSIPGFPPASAPGHAGTLLIGGIAGQNVALMSGRPHLYEGYDRATVTFPIQTLRQLGATALVVTNAAGAVNRSLRAGDLMLITDHIDLTLTSSYPGTPSSASFFRQGFRYDPDLLRLARREAQRLDIRLREGTYAGLTGPNYETDAELRMLERIGADAAGMSTVTEATEAFALGMKVLGISCIANSRTRDTRLTHDAVQRTVRRVAHTLGRLIVAVVSCRGNSTLPSLCAENPDARA